MRKILGVQISIPFVQSGSADSPNMRGSSLGKKREHYFQAMYVTLASLRRWNPQLDLQVITNKSLPEPYQTQFDALAVKVKITPFTYHPGGDYDGKYAQSLYYLDVLSHLDRDVNILLDPDILCTANLETAYFQQSRSPSALRLDYPVDKPINGLSRKEAGALHKILGMNVDPPNYYGGEIYVIPLGAVPAVQALTKKAWSFSERGQWRAHKTFQTEEHIFNYALSHFPVEDLNKYVARIWTTHRYRNVEGNEYSLPLWHLPAEKGRGFRKLYKISINLDSWFWRSHHNTFARRCGTIMGIKRRTPLRWLLDLVGAIINYISYNRWQ